MDGQPGDGQTGGVPSLDDVRRAAARISGRVRRTPLLEAAPARGHAAVATQLVLKLESLQVTGSFKARGACNALLALPPAALARGVTTASGGNHGLAVAYAGWIAGVPATIYLPVTAPRRNGASCGPGAPRWWSRAKRGTTATRLRCATPHGRACLRPPFRRSDGDRRARNGRDRNPRRRAGGGYPAGRGWRRRADQRHCYCARAIKPGIRIVGVEPEGAPTLLRSLEAGRPALLGRIEPPPGRSRRGAPTRSTSASSSAMSSRSCSSPTRRCGRPPLGYGSSMASRRSWAAPPRWPPC